MVGLLNMGIIALYSYLQHKGADHEKGIPITKALFKTTPLCNIGSFSVLLILSVLYSLFWS